MKRLFFLSITLLVLAKIIIAQETVTVNYTAEDQNGNYCPFIAMSITNETRGWTETIIYPDTIVVLTLNETGISEIEPNTFYVGYARPNPFRGETCVPIEMFMASDVLMKVIRIDGSELLSKHLNLNKGTYNVHITLAEPGVVYFVMSTNSGRSVTKLLNEKRSDNNYLRIEEAAPLTLRMEEQHNYDVHDEFEIGDMMSFAGVTAFATNIIYSDTITQELINDKNVVLRFYLPIPMVSTRDITNITQSMAIVGGNVIDESASTVTDKGVCWSLYENPSLNDSQSNYISSGNGVGPFTSVLSNLTSNTTYYVRAYATNSYGTAYGEQKSFRTANESIPIELCTTWGMSRNEVVSFGNAYSIIDFDEEVVAFAATDYSRDTLMMYLFESDSLYCATLLVSSDYNYYSQLVEDILEGYYFMETQNEVNVYLDEDQTSIAVSKIDTDCTISFVALPHMIVDTTAVFNGIIGGHDYVDIGLSVKWATCNIGADSPETVGYYFQWGETSPEINGPYSWYTYAYWTDLNGNGYVEPETEVNVLLPDIGGTSYDAAKVMWNEFWRMPTQNEIQELINNCQFESVILDGNNCFKITGPNGQSIYIPASGRKDGQNTYGINNAYIWSSIRGPWDDEAYCGEIKSSGSNVNHYLKCKGLTIRPVSDYVERYFNISVSVNPINGGTVNGGGTYLEGSTCTLSAVASDGFTFVNWTRNGVVVSTDSTYSFVVAEAGLYTANFTMDDYYTITATSDPSMAGSVMGSGNYLSGQTCNMMAVAEDGYVFVNWTENDSIVSFDAEYSFVVTGNRTMVANFYEMPIAPTGAIQGIFSVGDNQYVWFSQGNLQYVGSSQTWRFASNQWTVIGTGQGNSYQSTTRDLFGWGTSGWNCGNTYYKPWDTNNGSSNNPLYGPPGIYNLTGNYEQSDWGVYNTISNASGQWRTMTKEEWRYVMHTRNTSSGIRFALARVNNVSGVVLLPDNWSENTYILNNPNPTVSTSGYSDNIISATQWTILQNAGAVFLPVTGCRYGTDISNISLNNGGGFYWTTTACSNSSDAYVMGFAENQGNVYALPNNGTIGRSKGCSVRLVTPVPFNSQNHGFIHNSNEIAPVLKSSIPSCE